MWTCENEIIMSFDLMNFIKNLFSNFKFHSICLKLYEKDKTKMWQSYIAAQRGLLGKSNFSENMMCLCCVININSQLNVDFRKFYNFSESSASSPKLLQHLNRAGRYQLTDIVILCANCNMHSINYDENSMKYSVCIELQTQWSVI